MKTAKIIQGMLGLLAIAVGLSCSSEEDINEPPKENEQERRINEIIPVAYQESLKELGINVYTGTAPPNVEGIYLISPNTLQATNESSGNIVGHTFPDARISLSEQHAVNASIKLEGVNFIASRAISQQALIVGSGNNFTIYAKVRAEQESNAAIFNLVISATKEGDNLRNLKAAYVNIDNSNGGGDFIPEGSAHLIQDASQVSESVASLEDDPVAEDPITDMDSNLHIVGFQRQPPNLNLATYWHNGTAQVLDAEDQSAITRSVFMTGEDIYIAGTLTQNNRNTAAYWKNGTLTKLSDGSVNTESQSIMVTGNDVYVTGKVGNLAHYWKNGEPIELPSRGNSDALAIAISGNDVYIAGFETFQGRTVTTYWKNSEPINLTDATRNAEARGIFVFGSDVYVCGIEAFTPSTSPRVAKYWKNEDEIVLSGEGGHAFANAIVVQNGDVYVAGYQMYSSRGIAKYWKNGEEIRLTDGTQDCRAEAISVSGSDVYVVGFANYKPVYWKNGQQVDLPLSNDDIAQSSADAIFIAN